MRLLNEHASAAISLWTMPWFVIGKSFASAWSFFMLSQRFGDPVLDHAFLACAIAMWGVLFVGAGRFGTMAAKPAFVAAAWLLMSGAAVIVGLPLVGLPSLGYGLTLVGLVLGGFGFALIFNLWFEFYGRLEPVQVTFYLCLDIFFVEVIWWLMCELSALGLFVAVLICAMIAPFAVSQCFAYLGPERILENTGADKTVYPWKLYVAVFMYLFMSTFCKSIIEYEGSYLTIGYVITPTLVLAYLCVAQRFKMANFYRLAMPVLTAALFSAVIFDTGLPISWVLANVAYSLMLMFTRVETCYLTYRYKYNICKLFSLFNIVTYAANILGEDAVAICAARGVTQLNQVSVIAGCIIVVIVWTLLFLNAGSWNTEPLEEVVIDGTTAGLGNDAARLDAILDGYGLTPRERVVLDLLLEGATAKGVAAELYVSLGTAKVHIRNIYRKLDVHSREELVELVQSSE